MQSKLRETSGYNIKEAVPVEVQLNIEQLIRTYLNGWLIDFNLHQAMGVIPMPDAGILATFLLVIGLFLLGLEFFIPSFGLIGTLAGISLIVSLWSANQAWGSGANPPFFWTYVILLVAGIPGTILGSFYAIQHTSLGKSIVLKPPTVAQSINSLDVWIGKLGICQTPLTPGGMVVLDRERFHAESLGMLVDRETRVVVVAVSGNRLIVRPASQQELQVADARQAEMLEQSASAVSALSEPVASPEIEVVEENRDLLVSSEDTESKSDAVRPKSFDQVAERERGQVTPAKSDPDKLDFDIPEDYTA